MTTRAAGQALTRREFNAASVSALFVGMTVCISGCGGGSSASPASPTGGSGTPTASGGDRTATVSANHGHVASVTSAALQAGGAVSLSIKGSADHDHSVELTQTEVGQVAGGNRVAKTSSSDAGHVHTVTFN